MVLDTWTIVMLLELGCLLLDQLPYFLGLVTWTGDSGLERVRFWQH